MFSRFCSNKANAKAGHPAELGSGCSYSPLCGSVGCPALFMYFVPGFVPLLYHAVFHAAFQVRSNIFLHQSDQARAGFLRCPGDVRRNVQAVIVRHFQQRTVTADRLAGKSSSAAPAIRPLRRAQQRSRSFTIEPRPTLIRIAFASCCKRFRYSSRFSVASI